MLRVGILGCARIAPIAVVRPARRLADVQVSAVASRSRDRAVKFATRHKIGRVHATYADLISDPDINAVYVPLPNSLHAEWTLRALEAGKHVLCEKPLASNEKQAKLLATAARDSGLVAMEAFHYRYHPLMRRIQAIVASGELGELRRVDVEVGLPVVLRRDIRWNPGLDGGAAMDVGCYAVDIARAIIPGDPVVLTAAGSLTSRGVDRHFEATLAFPKQLQASVSGSILSRPMSKLTVTATDGRVSVFNPILPQLMYRLKVVAGSSERTEKVADGSTYLHQLAAFAAAVRGEAEVQTTFDSAVVNLRILDQIRGLIGVKTSASVLSASPVRKRDDRAS